MNMTRRDAIMRGTLGTLGVVAMAQSGPLIAGSKSRPKPGRNGKLTLLQINDSHGYLDLHLEWFAGPRGAVYRKAGGYARIATLAKQIRDEANGQMLFLDNGDTFHGTYPVVQSRGESLVPIMNELGLAAMTVHWDFAYGPQHLLKLKQSLKYPMLAINIYDKHTGKAFLPPYTIQEVGGLKVAVIGIASNIIDKTMPPHFSEGLRFTDGREELPGFIERVRSREKADLVVVLSHLGFPQDMKLLSEVPDVDVLLSGHTHHRLFEPVRQGKTLIIQSGCHGSFLGRLDLEIRDGRVVDHRHELIEVSEGVARDPKIEAMVKDVLKPYAEDLGCVVGEVSTALDRNANLESTMDNFLLQAIREAAGTPLAFCNGWRWGAPVKAGPVTKNDICNIISWEEPICTVDLTGRELVQMLEETLERTFSANPFHQLGGYVKRCLGLTAYVKIENPPGTRIQKLFVGQDEVKHDRVYSAAYLTVQAVPSKYGKNRKTLSKDAQRAMVALLTRKTGVNAELANTVIVN